MNYNLFKSSNYLKHDGFAIKRVNEARVIKNKHTHEFIEICYVFSGTGYHQVNGFQHNVHKGDIFIINVDMSHTFYTNNPKDELITYNIMFKPDFLDENLINMEDFNSISYSNLFKNYWPELAGRYDIRLDVVEQKLFDELVDKIHREYIAQENGYINIIKGYLLIFLTQIIRNFSTNKIKDNNKVRKRIIEEIINELKKNYDRKLDLQELSKKVLFSKSYICNLFKKSTGMTLSEYLNNLRIDEACILIKNSNYSLEKICFNVGFSDYKAFYEAFKNIKGIIPSEFIKISKT